MRYEMPERRDEDGASAVEYGLLVAAIAAIIVIIVFAVGGFTKAMFGDTCSSLDSGSTYTVDPGDCP
jgi:pilus assembly protein Flp/PilA